MSSDIRYGHVAGPGKGREYRVAADQYFSRKGGKFVYLSSGDVTMCASNTTQVMGWAVTPKDADGYNAWKSSATGRADKVFVITPGLDDVFELPVKETAASMTATYIGAAAGIVIDGSTYTTIMKAKIGACTASTLTVVDFNKDAHTVRVRVKPAFVQYHT
jgi:hypothetical protein